MPKRGRPSKAELAERAKKQPTADSANAAPATVPAEPVAQLVTDEQIATQTANNTAASKEIDELSKLRQQLAEETRRREEAERQKLAAENRLATLNESDAQILYAEQVVRDKQALMVVATEELKNRKKDFESAITELRRRIGDRLEGRPTLFDMQEVAAAKGTTPLTQPATAPEEATPSDPESRTDAVQVPAGKKRGRKPKAADAAAATDPANTPAAEVAADDARDDEKALPPAAVPEAPLPSEWWMGVGLGTVSVPDSKGGELLSLAPSLVSALADGGVNTVIEAANWLKAGEPSIKGVGPTGKKRLEEVLRRWQDTQGGDTLAGKAAPSAAATGAGPSHRLCGQCQNRWEMPSDVTVCPKCNNAETVYEVGYFGQPNADHDGDVVGGVDALEFRVPADSGDKSLAEYGFTVLVATIDGGHCLPGYEIMYQGAVSDAVYPNVKRSPRLTRTEATEHGLWLMKRAVIGFIASKPGLVAWEEAAKAAIGVEPKGHLNTTADTEAA